MDDHDRRGRDFLLRFGFSERVADIPGSHVQAKRYLVATNAGYADKLSLASQETLKLQGGPMSHEEVVKWNSSDKSRVHRARNFEEEGKVPSWEVTDDTELSIAQLEAMTRRHFEQRLKL